MNPSPIIYRRIAAYHHHPSSQSIETFCTSCIRSLLRCSSSGNTSSIIIGSIRKTVKIKPPPSLLKSQPSTHTTTTTQIRWHGGPAVASDAPTISLTFHNPHPSSPSDPPLTVQARIGETLLQTAQRNDIDLEGACEGVCACSTCHVIFSYEDYDALEEGQELDEDEEDMLDMANGLTETSRLGCQIVVSEEMEGLTVEVPGHTRNFYVDGHIPQPH